MATIQKRQTSRGRTRYTVTVRRRGSRTLCATFPTLSEARRWSAETEGAVLDRRHFRGAEARRRTVADLIDRYLAEIAPRMRGREPETRRRQLGFWRRELGHLLLADLTPARIVEARSKLTCGPATANRYLAALSHAVSFAVRDWEWMEDHPLKRVRRLQEPRGRLRFLSEEERAALLEACKRSSDARLYPLVLLALATGARQGELLRLRWSEADLSGGLAIIPETKSGEPRTVPLAPQTVAALRAMPRRLGHDLVFAGPDGAALFPRKPWERALEDSGIDGFTFHGLRHTAASYLAMSGASVRDIQAILGHRTIQMAQRYAHLTPSHLSDVAARMADRFLRE